MGKKGPCFHCGIEHSPLWRNGPPEKPVLCNSCGSRWRIWGDLTNYIPKHGMFPRVNSNDTQSSQQGKLPLLIEVRKPKYGASYTTYSVGFDKDANNESAGSVISSSDNCTQMESTTGQEGSGLVQPSFGCSNIPRRKRSVLPQSILSPVERLHRQLSYVLLEPEFSKMTLEQEDVLIVQNNHMSSAEIGLGCELWIN